MDQTKTSCNFMWITTILLMCILNWVEADPIVDTKLGKIRGTILITNYDKPVYVFRGIPYAKPPVNQLRFKPPEAVEIWNDTLDATENGNACIQYDLFRNLVTGDEDCLHLNVYTKQLTERSLRPVMVFIYGGGLNSGESSSHLYGPERLLDKDIVLVTFNYRLSALGFLSTEDAESPGNYGLLDQVEALKWIQNHVESFGGDPKNVVILGEGAGGASVVYHLVSPLSKGLFHGAIAQSGKTPSLWNLQVEPLEQAKLLAQVLNCPTDESKNLVNCLRKRTALEIMIKSSMLELANPHIINSKLLQYLPVIDKGFAVSTEFLPEHPKSLLEEHRINKVPVMLGNVNNGGYPFLLSEGIDQFDKEHLLNTFAAIKGHQAKTASLDKLAALYFNEVELADANQKIRTLSHAFDDLVINAELDDVVKAFAASGIATYAYHLTYSAENSIGSYLSAFLNKDYSETLKQVSHIDDLRYLFHLGYFPNKLTENDKQTVEKILTLWTNFAKNKIPSLEGGNVDSETLETFEWNPVQANQQAQYLNIDHGIYKEKGTVCLTPDLWKEFQEKDKL